MALNNVPLTGQTLAVTRNPVNNNFSTINAAFLVDHVEYNLTGQGKHNKVTFPSQLNAPTFTNPEIGLYNKVPAAPFPLTTVNELFIRRSDGSETPFTASEQTTNGWSYLPSGLLIKWGNITGNYPNGTWQQYLFPVAVNIPVFKNVFNITAQSVSLDTPPGTQTHTYNYITIASTFITAPGPAVTGFWWIPRTNVGNVNQQSVFYYVIGN